MLCGLAIEADESAAATFVVGIDTIFALTFTVLALGLFFSLLNIMNSTFTSKRYLDSVSSILDIISDNYTDNYPERFISLGLLGLIIALGVSGIIFIKKK